MRMELELIRKADPQVAEAIELELNRQRTHIELIASENFVSPAVMAAMGSCLTNKYAEGYPGKRYYGGCEYVDIVEELARKRACELFGAEQFTGALAGQLLYDVHIFAAPVIPLSGIAFRIFVRQAGTHGCHDGRRNEVLAGDQLNMRALTIELQLNCFCYLRIGFTDQFQFHTQKKPPR